MYNYTVILKGSNKKLAIEEFETLWSVYFKEIIELKQIQNIMYSFSSNKLISKNHKLLQRLTYTNVIFLNLFDAKNFKSFEENVSKLGLEKYDGKKFLVRVKKSKRIIKVKTSERRLAKPIWDLFKNPKVDIENPDIEFNFLFLDDNAEVKIKDKNSPFLFCQKIYENNKDYLRRMPKLRPIKMPYTLKSDMARTAINLLGLESGVVLDPFCGIGGILLEAFDMNFDVIGNDISWNDLKYFRTNFEHFYPNSVYSNDLKCIRLLADSQTQFLQDNSIDGVVTDIPYGKCSRRLGDNLYENFLKSSQKYLKNDGRLVVIYANFVEFKELALKYFDVVCEIEEYINRSMTRYILVLKNRKKETSP